jgi:hypothetical protein
MTSKFKFAFVTLIILSLGCKIKNENSDKIKPSKLQRLEYIRDSIGFISLPFIANFDSTIKNTYRIFMSEDDSIFRQEFQRLGDLYLIGFLPDTTNFYCILFNSVAAVVQPGLITLDKRGNKVSSAYLTKENCLIYVGDILLCKEYTIINKDLTLDYYYKSIVIQEKSDFSLDTVCTNLERKGKINNKGEITIGQMNVINCQDH